MIYLTDLEEDHYQKIITDPATPIKIKNDWHSGLKNIRSTMQLFYNVSNNKSRTEYYLLFQYSTESGKLIFSYRCQHPPTFMLSELENLLKENVRMHENKSYLVNQLLNSNGYRNLDQIIQDLFHQEMGLQIEGMSLIDSNRLFQDYHLLLQRTRSQLRSAIEKFVLRNENDQNLFFILMALEDCFVSLQSNFLNFYFVIIKSNSTILDSDPINLGIIYLKNQFIKAINFDVLALKHHLKGISSSNIGIDYIDWIESFSTDLDAYLSQSDGVKTVEENF